MAAEVALDGQAAEAYLSLSETAAALRELEVTIAEDYAAFCLEVGASKRAMQRAWDRFISNAVNAEIGVPNRAVVPRQRKPVQAQTVSAEVL